VTHLPSLHDRFGYRKYLNVDERDRFYRAVQIVEADVDRCFALILFYTGCRISEALRLTEDQVDLSERCLVFRTLKQRGETKHRAVPVPDDLIALLVSLPHGGGKFFPFGRTTAWGRIKAIMEKADLEGIKATPKGLRHSHAIAALTEQTPLPVIQRWLGHAKIETTSIYCDYVGVEERALAEKLWSRTRKS